MNDFISEPRRPVRRPALASVLDTIKELGFHYATQAGITISKNDIVIPENEQILEDYEGASSDRGGTTAASSPRRSGRSGSSRSGRRRPTASPRPWRRRLYELNPIYMMANSERADRSSRSASLPACAASWRTRRAASSSPDQGQLHGGPVGARVLHLDPRRPSGPCRHGASTADSWLPDPAFVDVSQDVIVRDVDCKTDEFIELPFLTRRASPPRSRPSRRRCSP